MSNPKEAYRQIYDIMNGNDKELNSGDPRIGRKLYKRFLKDGIIDESAPIIIGTSTNTPPPPTNLYPIARAGSDVSITLPINIVTLDGSTSSDTDGTISVYLWTKISGPSTYSIVSPNTAITAITGLIQGTYIFQLTVTDNKGAGTSDIVQITVHPAINIPPTANAGNDQEITLPTNSVVVFGNSSVDSDGTIISYLWTKVSGPNSYSISSPNSSITAINSLIEGTYIFRLSVTDNNGATSTDDITIVVDPAIIIPNVPPVANAGNNISITLPVSSTTLDGSSSFDTDGTIVSYLWTKVSGPSTYTISTPSSAITNVTGLIEGTYVFRLTVTDNSGATSNDDVTVLVNPVIIPPNQPPVADAGNNVTITLPTNSVNLSGAASTDSDGTIVSYLWSKISGPSTYNIVSSSSVNTAINNLVQGIYTFRLTVTDNGGATNTDDVVITVNPAPNQPPVANAGNDVTIILPTNTATLNGSASTDIDGSIVSYLWTKISGPSTYTIANANIATTALSNLVQGVYIFQLVVTDNSGASSSDNITVTVNQAANILPTANAGSDASITLPTNSLTLNGSGTDTDGTIVSYLWSKISGPTTYTINSPNSASTVISNLVQGTYVFRLTVTDNRSGIATDDVSIVVNPVPPPVPRAGALLAQMTATAIETSVSTAGLKIIRVPLFLSQTINNQNADKYLADGYLVELNIDWSSTANPVPFPTDLTLYRSRLTQCLDHYAPYLSQIPVLVCENEWENTSYHSNPPETFYIPEVDAFNTLAHTYGFKTSDGALSGNGCTRWTYSKLSGQAAIDWKNHYFVGLNNNYQAFLDSVNSVFSQLSSINLDYCNMHWYNRDQVSYGGMPTTAGYVRAAVGNRQLISNEFGLYYAIDTLWQTTLQEVLTSNMKYAIAYSGVNDPGKAIKLTDSMLLALAQTII